MTESLRRDLIAHLGTFVTENKKRLIGEVLAERTRYLTIALEDIYQSQNASATVRTADCMGLQDVYIMENYNSYQVNPEVTLGSAKWVDVHRYNEEDGNNTARCFQELREKGYRLVGTSLSAESLHPSELPLDQPLALIFGSEENGLSEYAHAHTDLNLKIPMYGFTQSFNISVSVAITLSHLTQALRATDIDWHLSQEEREAICLQWYRRIVGRSEIIEADFLKKNLP